MSEGPHRSLLKRLIPPLIRKPKNRAELFELLRDVKERKLLDHEGHSMIEGVLRVSEMKVRDVMIPRAQMVVLDQNATLESVLSLIIDSAHSRFPVISENRDKVTGILLAKDLLEYTLKEKRENTFLRDLMRPALLIPESKRLDILLKEFRLKRNHMAIVVDEYGGVSGLITIEDVLEQIVGNIEDETDIDDEEPNITPLNSREFNIKALTPINKFNEFFGTMINNDDCDTIGGYMMQRCGHLPKRGESVSIGGLKISVISANSRTIQLLRLIKQTPENE